MSDTSQGEGWWQASDGKWYAPESASPSAASAGAAPAFSAGPGGATLAEFGPRVMGFLIDWGVSIAVLVIGWILAMILGIVVDVLGFLVLLVTYAAVFGWWIYMGYLVGTKGQSPGMAMQGLRCVGEQTGQPIGAGMGIVRGLILSLSGGFCFILYFWPLWDPKNQHLGDKVASSLVYDGQPKQSFSVDLLKP